MGIFLNIFASTMKNMSKSKIAQKQLWSASEITGWLKEQKNYHICQN